MQIASSVATTPDTPIPFCAARKMQALLFQMVTYGNKLKSLGLFHKSECIFRSIRTLIPILSERLFDDPFPAVSTL
jgi:hypothetical protein